MTNDEARRNAECSNDEIAGKARLGSFGLRASFVIRHSCFVIFYSCCAGLTNPRRTAIGIDV